MKEQLIALYKELEDFDKDSSFIKRLLVKQCYRKAILLKIELIEKMLKSK